MEKRSGEFKPIPGVQIERSGTKWAAVTSKGKGALASPPLKQ